LEYDKKFGAEANVKDVEIIETKSGSTRTIEFRGLKIAA